MKNYKRWRNRKDRNKRILKTFYKKYFKNLKLLFLKTLKYFLFNTQFLTKITKRNFQLDLVVIFITCFTTYKNQFFAKKQQKLLDFI